MRAAWSTYWHLIRAGFRKQSQYRLATLAGLVANVVFGLIKAAVLTAAVRASGDFGGYDEGTMLAYVWITQGLLGAIPMGMGPTPEIAERIRTGDVAIDFVRPVDVQFGYLAGDLGRAIYSLLPRGLPSIAVGALTFGLTLPTTPWPYLAGAVSVLMAVALCFLGLFTIAIMGFWLVETRGLRTLYMVSATFFGGLFVPVHVFPDWLRTLAYATPFPHMLQTPVDVITGRSGAEVLVAQLCWLAVVTAASRLLLRAGRRKLEVQGG